MSARWLRPAVIALAVAGVAACAASSPTDAVKITYCMPGTGPEKPRALAEVRNRSPETSSFFVLVEFHDGAGDRVAEGVATVTDVDPGTSVPFEVTALSDVGGPPTCEVATVRRSAEL